MLLFNLSLYFYHWAHILVLCPAVYSTAPFRGLIRCYIFCKWWRHRCDISANKALFPPPLSIVPNIKLHSCIFLKWQRGQWENTERGSARKLSSLSRFSAESDSRLATSLREKKGNAPLFSYACHTCYLKCVRCLWMSRSKIGVGLDEPRGERSWLNKSWNSLQICLTDRRRDWGFTICLQQNHHIFSLFCTHPHHFGSTHMQI